MIELDQGGRVEAPTPVRLSRLNILVHPLWLAKNFDIDFRDKYLDSTGRIYGEAVGRFIPQNTSELLLVMPNWFPLSRTTLWHESRMDRRFKKDHPSVVTDVDLYRSLRKERSSFKQNVRLIDNVGVYKSQTADPILARIEGWGFLLDEDTEVVVGGEWIEQCVVKVAERLLDLPMVREVKIDKQVALWYGDRGIRANREDEDYFYLAKPLSSIKPSEVFAA